MPDESLEILVKMSADTSGGKEVRKDLDQTKEKAGESHGAAGAAAEKHETHIRGLHKIFHSLNEVVPGLGVAMQAAFSPIGAVVSIALMALRLFHEKMKEFNEECRKAAEEAAKPLTNRLEEQRETVARSAEGMERLRERLADAGRQEETVKDLTERTTAAFRAQEQAATALNDALKANELAGLAQQHARGLVSEEQYAAQKLEIEQRFLERKRELAEQEEMREILIRKRALEDAGTKQPELEAAAKAGEIAKEKAIEDLGSFDKEGIKKRHEESANKLKEFREKHGEEAEWFEEAARSGGTREALNEVMRRHGRAQYGTAQLGDFNQFQKLRNDAAGAEREWKQAPAEEAQLRVAAERASHDADRAAARAEENQRFITDTQRDVDQRRALYDERHRGNVELGKTERDTVEMEKVQRAIELSKNPEAMANLDSKARTEVARLDTRTQRDRRRALTPAEQTEAGAVAAHDISAAGETASAFQAHKATSTEQNKQLMDVASALAGHQVNFRQAVATMSQHTTNVGLFTKDVTKLVGVMEGLATMVNPLSGRLASLDAQVKAMKEQHRSLSAPP
jgi:hypothetical protein